MYIKISLSWSVTLQWWTQQSFQKVWHLEKKYHICRLFPEFYHGLGCFSLQCSLIHYLSLRQFQGWINSTKKDFSNHKATFPKPLHYPKGRLPGQSDPWGQSLSTLEVWMVLSLAHGKHSPITTQWRKKYYLSGASITMGKALNICLSSHHKCQSYTISIKTGCLQMRKSRFEEFYWPG